MKKIIKRLAILLMCAALVIGAPAQALAAEWDGESNSVITDPSVGEGSDYLEQDDPIYASTNVSIKIGEALEIIGQTEDCVIDVGDDLQLRVAVKGIGPINYLWEVSTDYGATWKALSDAKNAPTYNIVDAKESPAGKNQIYYYRATVSDSLGNTDSAVIQVLVKRIKNDYRYRRIQLKNGSIAVSAWMHYNTVLWTDDIEENTPVYNELTAQLSPGCTPVMVKDIDLTNTKPRYIPYLGDATVEFNVGTQYNGKTMRVVQLLDGEIIEHTGVVKDGILTIKAEKLSQFMVETPSSDVRTITVTATGGGTTTPSGDISVTLGTDKTIIMLPDEGWQIGQVLVDGQPATISGNSYTFANIKDDHTLDVTFEQIPPSSETHKVTVTAGKHGTTDPAGEVSVQHGSAFTVNFYPDRDYAVDKVLVNGVEYSVVGDMLTLSAVTADTEISVSFKKISSNQDRPVITGRTITATAGEGGSISPSGETKVLSGGEMYFYAIPDEGYVVDKVYVDGKEVSAPDGVYRFVNVVSSHTIHATFKAGDTPDSKYFKITTKSGTKGSISPAGELMVPAGGKQTFYFIPDSGYMVKAIYVNGKAVSFRGTSYTLSDVQSDTTVSVEFEPMPNASTGDTVSAAYVWCWVLLCISSGVAVTMFILLLLGKRRKDEEQPAAEGADI